MHWLKHLGHQAGWVKVGFPHFMNSSLRSSWMYTPSFSFPCTVVPSIRIVKRFDIETTYATLMTLISPCPLINSRQPSLLTCKDLISSFSLGIWEFFEQHIIFSSEICNVSFSFPFQPFEFIQWNTRVNFVLTRFSWHFKIDALN